MLDIAKDRETIYYLHKNLKGAISKDLGILFDMLNGFDAYPRVYHSSDHILDLCTKIIADKHNKYDEEILLYTALYHDSVYDPKASNNEEESARIFQQDSKFFDLTEHQKITIYNLILGTKGHKSYYNELSPIFYKYDLSGFAGGEVNVLANEMKIRKEYGWVDWETYKKEKLKFLESYRKLPVVCDNPEIAAGIDFLKCYIETEVPKNIAVYAGSFNPFHIGHKNIVEKSEKIFDKVIIAQGINPDKKSEPNYFKAEDIAACIQSEFEDYNPIDFLTYRQHDIYATSLVEYLNSKVYKPTLIRGLRDTTDLAAEMQQLRWLQAIDKDIKVVYIVCDKEFAHISSSGIRSVEDFPDLKKLADEYTC